MNYTVQRGDTLDAIAKRFHTTIDELSRINGIGNPNMIRAGQSLQISDQKAVVFSDAGNHEESWSETIMRFIDAIGRPIVGLRVKAVVDGQERLSTTDDHGCIPALVCARPNSKIDIHVTRAAHKGGGEKHIGTLTPPAGKQTVRVQSGQHVVSSKIRRHEGVPQTPPRQMKRDAPGTKIETATRDGNPLVCVKGCECPNGDDLQLRANLEFKDWIKAAAKRANLIPQAVAAVMNAESAKLKGGKWNAASKAKRSSATGMTQFLDATWVGEAIRSGTYLNEHAKKQGWLLKDSKGQWQFKKADGTFVTSADLTSKLTSKKMIPSWRVAKDNNLQQLLDLRYQAEFSIMAAMDYAKANLDALRRKGYVIDDLNDTEKARIMYLCHHLGGDAVHFIQNTIPEEDVIGVRKNGKKYVKQNGAEKLLKAQLKLADATTWYKKAKKSWVVAHRMWLTDFVGNNITPHVFTCPGDFFDSLKDQEKMAVLDSITDGLKK